MSQRQTTDDTCRKEEIGCILRHAFAADNLLGLVYKAPFLIDVEYYMCCFRVSAFSFTFVLVLLSRIGWASQIVSDKYEPIPMEYSQAAPLRAR